MVQWHYKVSLSYSLCCSLRRGHLVLPPHVSCESQPFWRSVVIVEHLNCGHESTHADTIIWRIANFLRLVIDGIEFTDFVAVTNGLEEGLDCITVTRHLEISFVDAKLGMRRGEEKVDCLRFVSVVCIVSDRSLRLVWNIDADGWAAERAVFILLLSHLVSTVGLHRLTKITVWLDFTAGWLSSDAFSGVPVHVFLVLAVSVVWIFACEALTKVFDSSEHVLCNGFLILHDFLNDNRFRETLLDSLRLDRFGSTSKESLLSVTERMGENVASALSNFHVTCPVVVSLLLFAGAEVTVRLLVHLGRVLLFLETASERVEHVLGRHTCGCWDTE